MNFFRQTNRQTLLLVSLFLSVALLCAQGVKLHIHNLDHAHSDQHTDPNNDTVDHGHLSKAHFSHDTSHFDLHDHHNSGHHNHDHHDGTIFEIDISPDGLLKNSSSNIYSIAIFALFFTLMIFVSTRLRVQPHRARKLIIRGYNVLSPPLRAPPLH